MTTPTPVAEAATNAIEFTLAHLRSLATGGVPLVDQIGAKRWAAGMRLPYRFVSIVPGSEDDWAAFPLVRVHTLAATFTEAMREGERTHRHMRILVANPQTDVILPDGRIRNCEWAEVTETPHEEPYAAESVATRVISEYRIALPFVAV